MTPSPGRRSTARSICVLLASLSALLLVAAAVVLTPTAALASASIAPSLGSMSRLLDLPVSQQAELNAGDAAYGDGFGYVVAVSGDLALVGAPFKTVGGMANVGAVYVFVRTGTTWTPRAELADPSPAAGDSFGSALAISGDTALIAADDKTANGQSGAGAAYVYTATGSVWTERAELTAADATAGDLFGQSLALSGDTALVGACQKSVGGQSQAGAAYVFTGSGATWSPQAELTLASPAVNAYFGYSVALSGDTALVGASGTDLDKLSRAGAAYVYTRSGASWAQQAELTAADPAYHDEFGGYVALSDGTALIGAVGKTVDGQPAAGVAYVFTGSDATWSQQAELTDPNQGAADLFGFPVLLSGHYALIGACGTTVNGQANAGAAYLFSGAGSSWTQQAGLTDPDAAGSDFFGRSLDLSGGTVLIGSQNATAGEQPGAGGAFVETLGTAPSNLPPVVSGRPTPGKTLSCSAGSWAGDPSPTFAYQWLRDGRAISGATTATHVVGYADCGHRLACRVTATNMAGTASATSAAVSVARPLVSLRAGRRAVILGQRVVLRGVVRHAFAAKRYVRIYRKRGHHMTLLKWVRRSGSGAFHFAVRPAKPGKWVFVTCYRVGGISFRSKPITVVVRR